MTLRELRKLDVDTIEQLANIIAAEISHNEITKYLKRCKLPPEEPDYSDGNYWKYPKWKRLYNSFSKIQNKTGISNNILLFIQTVFKPVKWQQGNNKPHETILSKLNQVLSYSGYELTKEGKIRDVKKSQTVIEARQRYALLKGKLEALNMHPIVIQACINGLVDGNWFHGIHESIKSLLEIIRLKSDIDKDGAELIDHVFSTKNPILKINQLSNETERSQQVGFMNVIKGMVSLYRNPTAHEIKDKITYSGEEAISVLKFVSHLHNILERI